MGTLLHGLISCYTMCTTVYFACFRNIYHGVIYKTHHVYELGRAHKVHCDYRGVFPNYIMIRFQIVPWCVSQPLYKNP